MSEATVRATLKTIVESVSNVGVVHDYERWAVKISDYINLFKTDIGGVTQIRGWTITCTGFPTVIAKTFQGNLREYEYAIRGRFSLLDGDASEKAAMIVAENVVEAIDNSLTLGRKGEFPRLSRPTQLPTFGHVLYGSVLCHFAEISVGVFEMVSTT